MRQKLSVAAFLCLSIFMIVVAIVRIAGLRLKGPYLNHHQMDIQWDLFWQEIEATVAVIMVSITAFRSLLGMKTLKSPEGKDRRHWYSYRLKRSPKASRAFKSGSSQSSQTCLGSEWDTKQLPAVPGPTLTGMQTFVRGDGDLTSRMMEAERGPLRDSAKVDNDILVTSEISWAAKKVRNSCELPSFLC